MPEESVWVTTLFGHDNQEPMVEIELRGNPVANRLQLPVPAAEEFVRNVQAAIQSTMTDGFLVTWFQEWLGLEPIQIAQILAEFRQYREARISRPPDDVMQEIMEKRLSNTVVPGEKQRPDANRKKKRRK